MARNSLRESVFVSGPVAVAVPAIKKSPKPHAGGNVAHTPDDGPKDPEKSTPEPPPTVDGPASSNVEDGGAATVAVQKGRRKRRTTTG